MHPPFSADLAGQAPARTDLSRRSTQPSAGSSSAGAHASSSHIRRPISDESWIEVASQPSSSSLSSSSAAARSSSDEVITTGLRVTQSVNPRRRRRLRRSVTERVHGARQQGPMGGASSSQDEYDESESGSDRVMTSSNEEHRSEEARFLADETEEHRNRPMAGASFVAASTSDEDGHIAADDEGEEEEEEEDDENATALGVAQPSPLFTPQPNAFSHPPSSRLSRLSSATTQAGSYFPPASSTTAPTSTAPTSSSSASSQPSARARLHTRTRSHTPYTALAPGHSVPIDHDAALRASLSTLLSCAAAARGLPKRELSQDPQTANLLLPPPSAAAAAAAGARRSSPPQRIEPSSLRLVSEATLGSSPSGPAPTTATAARSRSGSSSASPEKRKSKSPSAQARRKRRAAPAAWHIEPEDALHGVSPTLMTWVLGAGVMVLFSAVSFSAGYALGKEVGRVDGGRGWGGVGPATADVAAAAAAGDGEGWLGDALDRSGLRGRIWRWGNASGIRA